MTHFHVLFYLLFRLVSNESRSKWETHVLFCPLLQLWNSKTQLHAPRGDAYGTSLRICGYPPQKSRSSSGSRRGVIDDDARQNP